MNDRFADWLAASAESSPDHDALVVGGRRWSYTELDKEASVLARRMATLGVEAGDRVATLLHNGAAAAILPHAVLRLGATILPLNIRISGPELDFQITDSAPRLVLAEAATLPKLSHLRESLPDLQIASMDDGGAGIADTVSLLRIPESPAQLRLEHDFDAVLATIYTSGTTGTPKGAMLTVGNFYWSAKGSSLRLGVQSDDRWLACLPLFHVGGLSILMRSAIHGTTVVVHEQFDEVAVNAAIDSGDVTMVSVVAVMLQRMLDARDGKPYPSTLRLVLLGGGPAPHRLLERCAELGVPVAPTYGLTEACSQVATLAPHEPRGQRAAAGSVGRALEPNEIRIDGDGDIGEILVRGPIVMAGYVGRPEETARTIVDGWLRTGDIGTMNEDGDLIVLDRRDDLIVTGGENVYPAEVESVLLAHPSVVEAAVVGRADAEWGQRVVAVVRCDVELDSVTLEQHCRQALAGYKVPREYQFVTGMLPRTASGKMRRGEVRARLDAAR